MLGEKTVKALLTLNPSGPRSFEDLLRELLSALSGQTYHLSSAGRQSGVDGVSVAGSIGFEAKRYGDNQLDFPSLLGKLDQASRDRPDLELWIVGTTGRLGAQHQEELNESATARGLSVLLLGEGDLAETFHPLAGLCATNPNRVCEVLADQAWRDRSRRRIKKTRAVPTEEVHAELLTIADQPEFESFRATLQQTLRELPTWKTFVNLHNQRLKRAILSSARAELGSDFHPGEVIPRTVKAKIDEWLTIALPSPEPPLGIVVGEKFDGKTWAVFDWLIEKLDTLNLPVFFLSSGQGDVANRLEVILLAEIERSLGPNGRHARALLQRHRPWRAGRTPWCVLVLDGINEYKSSDKPEAWYRHLSDALACAEVEVRSCAVLCSMRKTSWPEFDRQVRKLALGGLQTFTVGPFDDREFATALAHAGAASEQIAELPESARTLLRRPRFLRLVLDHPDRLGNFEEINEDVLYYLDVTDKLRGDRTGSVAGWSEETYQEVLLELAKRAARQHVLARADVLDSVLTQIRSEEDLAIKDLLSEGVLERAGRKFNLCTEHLHTGMGLLLLDLVSAPGGRDELRERLRDTLSPYNDDDIVAIWLRRASVFALLSGQVSEDAIDTLVDEWLRSRNRPPDDLDQLKQIRRWLLRPLLRLASRTWGRGIGHRGLQELSLMLFSEAAEREPDVVRHYTTRWCRLVPARGPSFVEDKPGIEETVRGALEEGSLKQLDLQSYPDSGCLRLHSTALYLESVAPGLLSADDLFATVAAHHIPFYYLPDAGPWIVRQALAGVPHEWFENRVAAAAQVRGSRFADSLYHLLDLADRADLVDLLALIEPEEPDEEPAFRQGYLLERAEYEAIRSAPFAEDEKPFRFLERARELVIDPELPPPGDERLAAAKQAWREAFTGVDLQLHNAPTREDHDFRDASPAIAAWAPEEGAAVVRRQMADLARRFAADQHWWVLSIRRHAVLAAGAIRAALQRAVRTPYSGANSSVAPGYPLLALLPGMRPQTCVRQIIEHPLDIEWGTLYTNAARLNAALLHTEALKVLDRESSPRERIRAYHLLTELGKGKLSKAQRHVIHRDLESDDPELRVAALGAAAENELLDLPPDRLLELASDREEDRTKTYGPANAAWLLIQGGQFLDRLTPTWRAVAAVVHPQRREQLFQDLDAALGGPESDEDEGLAPLPAKYELPVRCKLKPGRARLGLVSDDRTLIVGHDDSALGGLDENTIDPEELEDFFNEDLHLKKRNQLVQEGSELRRQRQEEYRTAWSSDEFPQELVDALGVSRFDQWVTILLRNQRHTWWQWMGLVVPVFRRALCRLHLSVNELWELVNPLAQERWPGGISYVFRGIDWVFHELSRAETGDVSARELLRRLILEARTDMHLFAIALGARCQDQRRLEKVVAQLLQSDEAEHRARAARLLGWLEGTEERLRQVLAEDPSLWVRRIAALALRTRQREAFARHWLASFLRQDLTREQRWGAAQLFLQSVDGCLEAWAFRFVRREAPDVRIRGEALLLLDAARDEVKQRRSGDLDKYFLGAKVSELESGCHPWRQERSWHDLERTF